MLGGHGHRGFRKYLSLNSCCAVPCSFWVFSVYFPVFLRVLKARNPWRFWGFPWCFRKDQGKEGQGTGPSQPDPPPNHKTLLRKIPAPIKIKSALPPPCPKTQNPKYPPPKTRNSMGMEVYSCRKNTKIPGAQKIGTTISGPRIAGKEMYGHEAFSELLSHHGQNETKKEHFEVIYGSSSFSIYYKSTLHLASKRSQKYSKN